MTSYHEYHQYALENGGMDDHEPPKSCTRCNAGMPSYRVNSLCEECFAEESDQYDPEAEND